MNLKLILAIILVSGLCGIAGIIYWQAEETTASTSIGSFTPNRAEVHHATLELLAAAPDILRVESTFLTIVSGQDEASWSIRGTFNKENRNIPLFATLRYHCAYQQEKEHCWSLDELIVDGVHSPTSAPTTKSHGNYKAAAETNVGTPQPTDSRQLRKTQKTRQTVPVNTGTSPIWRTRSNNVNARFGPSIDAKTAFKMKTTTPLELIEQRKHWGLFKYPTGAGQLGQVWIHMNMVQKSSR